MNWSMTRIGDVSEEELTACYESLSESRKAHMDRFRNQEARRQSLAAELALRKLLQELGIDDTIVRLPSGQPALARNTAFVSIAHCEDFAVCAVHEKPVGIDIEKLRPVKPGMAQRICTEEELSYVQEAPDRFFEIWTGKEAYFKMAGTGITNFQAVNVLTLKRTLFRREDHLIQIVTEE